jgi:L-lactate dehydrogenase complex protein LldG
MSGRDTILATIARNRPSGDHALPAIPRFPQPEEGGRVATFLREFAAMGGSVVTGSPETDTIERVKEKLSGAVICSAVPEIAGNRRLDQVAQPRDLADVDVGIVRALLGVAETGSVLFTETELVVNTLAYLAQHLVVLLDPADIVSGLQDAYDRPEFHQAAYAVFHTGPSGTGDIEGVLIHPAQGVRTLTVAFIPRSQPGTVLPADMNLTRAQS